VSVTQKLINLTRQLYPTGRAFKMPEDGILHRLHTALGISEESAYNNALAILNSILPDNSAFTADDATDWERRLGMISNPNVSLADRKAAIIRKMNHPGNILGRQHYLYLQGQLQAAGFDVYVYENRFDDGSGGYETRNPLVVSGGTGSATRRHGMFRHGMFRHGVYYRNIIANHIDEDQDWQFSTGDNLRSTFFIGGSTLGAFADVDEERKNEFRQLILRIKPVQTVGFLLVNYI
jgi:hypothetical protein